MEAICSPMRPGVGVVVMSRFVKTLVAMSAIDRDSANFVCWYTRNCAVSLPAFVILAAGHFCIVLCSCLGLAPCAKLHTTSCCRCRVVRCLCLVLHVVKGSLIVVCAAEIVEFTNLDELLVTLESNH